MIQIRVTIQGKQFTPYIRRIQQLMADHPNWGRTRLSEELCRLWNWRGPTGQLKDMACRTLLLKLEQTGVLVLPPRQRNSTNGFRNRSIPAVSYSTEAISGSLKTVQPLQISILTLGTSDQTLFRCLLARYHYLGLRNTVGENLQYLIRDARGRPLACVLFGSTAWKTAPRDRFIGWDAPAREKNLIFLTNNTRFLILPWVKVPHLA